MDRFPLWKRPPSVIRGAMTLVGTDLFDQQQFVGEHIIFQLQFIKIDT